MSRLPRVTGADVARALRRGGYEHTYTRGSHYYFEKPDRPTVCVPMHAGAILPPKTLRSILHQAGLSAAALRELL